MDEEDGRPGAQSRQLGPSDAPLGVALPSLFLRQFTANSRQQTVAGSRAPAVCQRENIPQGLKPSSILVVFSARLKSWPFTKSAPPLRGFAAITRPYPTLKRGANNRCAYGALGTTEVVPFQSVYAAGPRFRLPAVCCLLPIVNC